MAWMAEPGREAGAMGVGDPKFIFRHLTLRGLGAGKQAGQRRGLETGSPLGRELLENHPMAARELPE